MANLPWRVIIGPRTGSFLRCFMAARMKLGPFRARPYSRSMRTSDCMKLCGVVLAALMILPTMPSRMTAQQPAAIKDEELGAQIKVDVNVVTLYATVHDKHNGIVASLTKDDFDLAEDGKPQTIKYFSRETDLPLTMGLMIDVSGSQQNLIESARQAGAQILGSMLKAKDEAFLISFGADSDLLQDLTGSPRLLQQGLQRLK